MKQRTVQLSTAEISKQIAWYTIGFAILSVHDRVEDVDVGGTGSLVMIGSVKGVLTAAHVLKNLPDTGEVGIVLYHDLFSQFQKQKISMEHAEKVTLSGEEFGPEGPDLGFLRLPPKNVSSLNSTNSFYNLGMLRDDVLASKEPTPSHVDAIVGIIAERTKEVPSDKPLERLKRLEAIFCSGEIVTEKDSNGYDLLDFAVTTKPNFELPVSFEGTSGGALWRFYLEMKNDSPSAIAKRLVGVPFYQSTNSDEKQIITCHGPMSVYRNLIDKIVERWPDEAILPKPKQSIG